jgi:elongation factor P--beta-lysine ligase
MSNNKQSSVEWLAVEIYHEMSMTGSGRLLQDILDEAIVKHKLEIQNAFTDGVICGMTNPKITAKEYYKEKYESDT